MTHPARNYASPLWRQLSPINPITRRRWAAGDELICSCDARVRVGARGFSALSKHHQTVEHGKRLKRKIRAAVTAAAGAKMAPACTDHASPDSVLLAPGASTVLSPVSLFEVAMPPTLPNSATPPGPSLSVYLPTASKTGSSNASAALVPATPPSSSPSYMLTSSDSPVTTKVDSKPSRASGTFGRFLMLPRDTKSSSSYSKKTPRVRQSLTHPSPAGKSSNISGATKC